MTPAGPRRVLDRLERAYGRPRPERRWPPLDELVLTILSQNTNDRNRDRAYAALRRALPTWEAVEGAPRSAVEAAVRVAGLARTKARTIQEVLTRLRREHGRLDLAFLKSMPPDRARAFLRSFHGVGEKTARCVLLFSCGVAAFPVDTHIHRVGRRLGWVPPGATRDRSHEVLAALLPPRRYYSAHVNLITLGRKVCRAGRPECPACPLRRLCPSAGAWPAAGTGPILHGRQGFSGNRRSRRNAREIQGRPRPGGRRGARPGPHRRAQGSGGA